MIRLPKEKIEEIIKLLQDANDAYDGEWGNIDDDVYDMIEYLKELIK